MENASLREYGAFIPECEKRGISESRAYELMQAGLLETFTIARKRFVYLDSLLTLPKRAAEFKREKAE